MSEMSTTWLIELLLTPTSSKQPCKTSKISSSSSSINSPRSHVIKKYGCRLNPEEDEFWNVRCGGEEGPRHPYRIVMREGPPPRWRSLFPRIPDDTPTLLRSLLKPVIPWLCFSYHWETCPGFKLKSGVSNFHLSVVLVSSKATKPKFTASSTW